MNKEETLALHAQGKDAWNAWASGMLVKRAEMEKDSTWELDRGGWFAEAKANFEDHSFDQYANFNSVIFPGDALFRGARFSGLAVFADATFSGLAVFADAMFSQNAGFERAIFSRDALFRRAQFGPDGDSWFKDARFEGCVDFRDVGFCRYASFANAIFSGQTDFSGAVTFAGDADFGSAKFCRGATFESTKFAGLARFAGATFGGDGNFGATRFGGVAAFSGATFGGDARFDDRVTFIEHAVFLDATFSREAWFVDATFKGGATFDRATFRAYAVFDRATFGGAALFFQATFGGYTSFASAKFKDANFFAVHAERGFTLAEAAFERAPDFIQAHFEEAPRLDNLKIPELKGIWNPLLRRVRVDHDTSARYRALKRLAIQSHDHQGELNYFASELKASRRNFFGFLYELLSDFGRSMRRPLFWLLFATLTFTVIYLLLADRADRGCFLGLGEAAKAALALSIHKALPFAGVASAEKLNQIYAHLYGVHGDGCMGASLPERFTPVIPYLVDNLGILQSLISLVLIFLFLLAVRNHFRIR